MGNDITNLIKRISCAELGFFSSTRTENQILIFRKWSKLQFEKKDSYPAMRDWMLLYSACFRPNSTIKYFFISELENFENFFFEKKSIFFSSKSRFFNFNLSPWHTVNPRHAPITCSSKEFSFVSHTFYFEFFQGYCSFFFPGVQKHWKLHISWFRAAT